MLFYAKMVFTEPEVNFSDLETTSLASKSLLVHQEVVFAKPEVTTFLPEVKFLKPEVRPMTLKTMFLYPKIILKWPKIAFLEFFK